jgi:hypothetical protein
MTEVTGWHAFRDRITRCVMQPVSSLVFTRALTIAVLLKVLAQWAIHAEVLSHHQLRLPRASLSGALLYPARFANAHPNIFFSAALVFLLVHLVVRRNVLTAVLFSALAFNLFMINRPTGDGGDLVTFMLSLWAIFLVPPDATAGPYATIMQTAVYNVARIGCLLQFVFLYLGSGVDKLRSSVWTSGHAFNAMRAAGGIISPDFPFSLQTPFWDVAFTWCTIVLEIVFGILIWFRMIQPGLVLSAIIFHLGIWWMLDLPDFALIMIVALLLFIRDDQYLRIFRPWLLSK